MENKKFTKKEALKEISDILIELDKQEEYEKGKAEKLTEIEKLTKEAKEIENAEEAKIISAFGSKSVYDNYVTTSNKLSSYFGKKIRLNKSGYVAEFIVDDKILLRIPHSVFKKPIIDGRYNIIRNLLSPFIFKKEHAYKTEVWSYINEDEESKSVSEQTEYNQTLCSLFQFGNFDNLVVNIKLKPLIDTLSGYNSETTLFNSKIKVTFVPSPIDENIIYAYKSSYISPKIGKTYLESYLDLFVTLFGDNAPVITDYIAIEIANLDNGLFGIKNKLFRVENNKELVMYISTEADLEYILEIIKFNKRFQGIEHIDLKNPDSKYSYHTEMLSKIKNKQI